MVLPRVEVYAFNVSPIRHPNISLSASDTTLTPFVD